MEALLLGIYSFFVWLIFIKFKWLPWTTPWKITVVIIPIVALSAMILALNVVAPSSADVRVFKYVVQVIPQVKGRVLEVPVEPNRLVKKGELLFRIDPTQYQNELNVAKAKLAADEAKLNQASANVVDVSPDSLILEVTGTEDKIEQCHDLLAPYGIREMSRTGRIAMNRGGGGDDSDGIRRYRSAGEGKAQVGSLL